MIKTVKSKNNKGVTMVELLIYIGLLSLFLTVLTTLFVSIFKLQLTTQSTSSLTQDTRFIIARMGYDIENASSVSVISPSTLQFNGTSSYSRDESGNLILTIGGVSNKLNGLDTSISGITFQKIGSQPPAPATPPPPTIQVKFTINSNVIEQSGPRSQDIQTTYGLR
jgi:type II secretory pathway component PulJ